jgi:hypothetical protein
MTRTPLLPTLLLCLALIANSVGAAWATTLAGQAGCRHAAGQAATAAVDTPAASPRSHAHHAAGHDAHAAVPAVDGHATAHAPAPSGHCGDCVMPSQSDRSDALADHGGHHDSHAPDGDCACASGGCACPALHVAQAMLPPALLLDPGPVHVRLTAPGPGVRPAPPPAVPTRPPISG